MPGSHPLKESGYCSLEIHRQISIQNYTHTSNKQLPEDKEADYVLSRLPVGKPVTVVANQNWCLSHVLQTLRKESKLRDDFNR